MEAMVMEAMVMMVREVSVMPAMVKRAMAIMVMVSPCLGITAERDECDKCEHEFPHAVFDPLMLR